MNRRRRGSGITFVAPPGPLASAPAASASNQNLFYMSTDFGLCQYVSGFLNAGADSINIGRPQYLIDLIHNNQPFTITGSFRLDATTQAVIFGNDGDAFANRTVLRINNAVGDLDYYGQVRGAVNTQASPDFTGGLSKVALSSNGSTFRVIRNDSSVTPELALGTGISVTDFKLSAFAFEGLFLNCCIYSGSTTSLDCSCLTLLDKYDINKWDGSTSGKSDMGYTYTVTKATPFTELSYACVPMSLL